jgi:hypothetical protein
MEFTKEERRMIAWLRYQHENWRTKRLVVLAASTVCGLWGLAEFIYGMDHGMFLGMIGFYGISRTVGNWRGRPEISLLLKLIETQEKECKTCGLDSCGKDM